MSLVGDVVSSSSTFEWTIPQFHILNKGAQTFIGPKITLNNQQGHLQFVLTVGPTCTHFSLNSNASINGFRLLKDGESESGVLFDSILVPKPDLRGTLLANGDLVIRCSIGQDLARRFDVGPLNIKAVLEKEFQERNVTDAVLVSRFLSFVFAAFQILFYL